MCGVLWQGEYEWGPMVRLHGDVIAERVALGGFFKQKTAYESMPSLVGSEMCIRAS